MDGQMNILEAIDYYMVECGCDEELASRIAVLEYSPDEYYDIYYDC